MIELSHVRYFRINLQIASLLHNIYHSLKRASREEGTSIYMNLS